MHKPPRSAAQTKVQRTPSRLLHTWVMGSFIGVAALWAGSEAFADAHEAVELGHVPLADGELDPRVQLVEAGQ